MKRLWSTESAMWKDISWWSLWSACFMSSFITAAWHAELSLLLFIAPIMSACRWAWAIHKEYADVKKI
jgi:uncharacterized membrane protein